MPENTKPMRKKWFRSYVRQNSNPYQQILQVFRPSIQLLAAKDSAADAFYHIQAPGTVTMSHSLLQRDRSWK
ncbi:hypothetical protein [Paenibacillus sp. S150]|uniref:hypothetical protein n=1 Tax=Paenibacillus sp. S150 TaxID=2749826 RepID=UPI001C59C65D|nr:hypothetical protein [Paenibacillus sp. S150]MBW4083029.1 hypothetical protein [Paenibacillus sp. S150]